MKIDESSRSRGEQTVGVVLMNLGSPDSPQVRDVRRYLNEFLMDGRVIDYPAIPRALLVRGIIVPFRAANSAHAYSTIWTEEGSPLLVLTRALRDAMAGKTPLPIEIAMRYGNPTPKAAFDALLQKQPSLKQVILVPLYPHYAMSSYETAVEYARLAHKKGDYQFELSVLKPYYDRPEYIATLADSIRPYLAEPFDKVLFSYHGIPERHVRKSDPTGCHCLRIPDCCNSPSVAHATCYRHQCFRTTSLVKDALELEEQKYETSFQSRLGRSEWLKPYTAKRLTELAGEGVKRLVIVCPAFASDCLETLEEIAVEGRKTFLDAGGETFALVPCLNVHPDWVQTLCGWTEALAAGEKEMAL